MNTKTWTCLLLVAVISSATLCIGWGKKDRTTEDLVKIAVLGGGLVLDASSKDANDLLKIAADTTQTVGASVYWYFKCSDGTIQIELNASALNAVGIMQGHVNDY